MVQRSCLSKNYDGGPDKEGKSRERPAASFDGTLRLGCRLVLQGGRGARRVHWTLRKSFVTRMRSGFFCREGSTNFKLLTIFVDRRPSCTLKVRSTTAAEAAAVEQVSQYTWFFLLMMMTCCYAEECSGGQHAARRRKRLTSNLENVLNEQRFWLPSDSLKLLPPQAA